MRVDCEWYDDPEQYVVLTSGTDSALSTLLYTEHVPNLSESELHIHNSNTSQLRVKKHVWYALHNTTQVRTKAYCEGFAIGFDHGQYD